MAEEAAIKAAADSCIGSLISLTTKSGMRYEGSMLHVDAQECTIALHNVKSFGTEGRRPVFVVSPSDKIYDYIVFDGNDIKDVRVISSPSSPPSVPSLLDDPAIIESRDSLPPPMHTGLLASTSAVKAPNQQFTKEAAASIIPGLLPVPSTSLMNKVSRKFVLPSDLLPNVAAAASLSLQSSLGQVATPQSGFSPVSGPLSPNYPHGVLSGVIMGSASKTADNVSAVPASRVYSLVSGRKPDDGFQSEISSGFQSEKMKKAFGLLRLCSKKSEDGEGGSRSVGLE
ncbi:protein LSM14 homolog B-A-like [Ipomoea triloba]|uniref:protein LSM14 homolog B-A-like n=1 Tax=Ipomoea triloba TaxID=35885 RepID=UPI00125E015C|nr:protein LSM14 homolog B-A-like [Ipomoea triloba]